MEWLATLEGIDWKTLAMSVGLKLLGGLLIFLIGLRVARWVSNLAQRGLERAQVEPIATLFLRKATYIALLVVLILAVLQVFGVPTASMFAVLGAAGLAIGLALKDSLANIASGVMLVALKPFRVGDIVTINGETGKVMSVSIFQTCLRGADNQVIVLPNSLVTSDSIINLTPDVMRRIELVVGIGYGDDIEAARGVALDVMKADRRVLADPAPDVLVYTLADFSVNLGIRCHVANDDFFVTKCELTERIKLAFDDAGITIPFPQRDVHMYQHLLQGQANPGLPPPKRERGEQVGVDSREHKPRADPE